MTRKTPTWLFAIACCLLLTSGGCLELDVRVHVNEDGSATITEKLAFSQALLDLASASPQNRAILDRALSKEGALERVTNMGDGAELLSHTIADTVLAGTPFKQATAVYKIPDINHLKLSAPFPNLWPREQLYMTFLLEPCYERKPLKASGGRDLPGYMAVEYRFASDQANSRQSPPRRDASTKPSPAEVQATRALLPIIQDMARTFSVKVTLESYNTLCDGWWSLSGPRKVQDRDKTHSVPYVELLNISGQNNDAFDRPLIFDEDTLLELVRGDWTGTHFKTILLSSPRPDDYRFLRDGTVPLVYPAVTANQSKRFIFLPSMFHYKKYFEGKKFDDKYAPEPPTH